MQKIKRLYCIVFSYFSRYCSGRRYFCWILMFFPRILTTYENRKQIWHLEILDILKHFTPNKAYSIRKSFGTIRPHRPIDKYFWYWFFGKEERSQLYRIAWHLPQFIFNSVSPWPLTPVWMGINLIPILLSFN